MDKERADFDAWLTANNISKDILPHGGMGGGPRGGHGDMQPVTANTTTTN